MNAIDDLARKLGDSDPLWRVTDLTGGETSPLVTAGVLVPDRLAAKYRCTSCDADCPGVLHYFPVEKPDDAASGVKPFAAHCLKDGHRIAIDAAELTIWTCQPHRLAELVQDALDCEKLDVLGEGRLFSLGQSRYTFGHHTREICILDHLDAEGDAILQCCPDGDSYLLFVGRLNCAIANPQFRRRVFTFKEALRLTDDGRMEVVMDAIACKLEEPLDGGKASRPRRADRQTTERKLLEYFVDILDKMLRTDEAGRRTIRKDALKLTAIAKAVGIAPSTLSQVYLGREVCQTADCAYRFFFKVCKDEDNEFVIFKDYLGEQRATFARLDPQQVYLAVSKRILANSIQTGVR